MSNDNVSNVIGNPEHISILSFSHFTFTLLQIIA